MRECAIAWPYRERALEKAESVSDVSTLWVGSYPGTSSRL